MVWVQGYCDGQLKGYVYLDVVQVLCEWKVCGLDLYVYFFGLIQVQKLIFGCFEVGDLGLLFFGYFDIISGLKWESVFYVWIVGVIGLLVVEIFFFFDVVQELDVVCDVGMCMFGLVCEGGSLDGYLMVVSFVDIFVE